MRGDEVVIRELAKEILQILLQVIFQCRTLLVFSERAQIDVGLAGVLDENDTCLVFDIVAYICLIIDHLIVVVDLVALEVALFDQQSLVTAQGVTTVQCLPSFIVDCPLEHRLRDHSFSVSAAGQVINLCLSALFNLISLDN